MQKKSILRRHDQLKASVLIFSFLAFGTPARGGVTLPRLVSDGMVLQRDQPVKIWGWAEKGEKVAIHFIETSYGTMADSNGEWQVILSPHPAGGPFAMQIDTIMIHDVLVGDVWVCSGQSNMELPMERVRPLYESEIAGAVNHAIRQFLVPQRYDFVTPHSDVQSGSWKSVTPENVLTFSAVGYFFAKKLYETYGVPIGIVNASLGGSPAQAWMSESALREFPAYFEDAQRFRDSTLIRSIEESDRTRIRQWYTLLREKDAGYKIHPWFEPGHDISDWGTMRIPGYWADTPPGEVNGVVWFRKEIRIPPSIAGKASKLILGRIVDADSVFINGRFVGTTSYQYPPRRYDLPADLLKPGINTIVVRVINSAGKGGFVPDKQYEISAGGENVDLKGDWRYRPGATMEPLERETFIRWKPLGLYNGMLAPLLNYRILGVVWYQGESNAEKPLEYRELLPAMIRDWRHNWRQGDFPFVIAQLPNYMEAKSEPGESNWALMRESQLMTLSLPHTGMAVTIDIGEWNDIHPLNKKDVGSRLALAARRVAYGDNSVVTSGPLYNSMSVEGDTARVTFTCTGSGLVARGALTSFAIAGPDKHFVWANARIAGNNVVVWSATVAKPVAVRYAWADSPQGAFLYNKEGLPASPFRTDDWD